MGRLGFFILALAGSVILFPWLRLQAAPAPANDSFNNRISIVLTNVMPSISVTNVVTGRNVSATKQPGEPDHAQNPGGKSVWWTWTAPLSGDARLTTDGSDFDTLLAVYTGTAVSSLTPVAQSDDHGVVVTSRVRFRATAGTAYQIAVDGYGAQGVEAESGNITLVIAFIGDPVPRPSNDDFTNSAALTGTAVVTTNSNRNATREFGEPLHSGEGTDTSVWWVWTPAISGNYSASTAGSGFDTILAIYHGDSLASLVSDASNDDFDSTNGVLTSRVAFDAVAGTAYRIVVDGYDGASGTVVLSLGLTSPWLSSPAFLVDGRFRFTVNGIPGGTNDILASSDCISWTNLATVVTTNGRALFTDPASGASGRRYYRTVLRR